MTLKRISLPPTTKLGQGYVFTGVYHSVNGGVLLPPGVDTPQSRHPPTPGADPLEQTPLLGADPPQEQTPPPQEQTPTPEQTPPWEQTPPTEHSMLGDTINARAVRILLKFNFNA